MPKTVINSLPEGTDIYIRGRITRSKIGAYYTDKEVANIKNRAAQYNRQLFLPDGQFGEIAISNAQIVTFDPQRNDWVPEADANAGILNQWLQEEGFTSTRYPERQLCIQKYIRRLDSVTKLGISLGAGQRGVYELVFPKDANGTPLELAAGTDVTLLYHVGTYTNGNRSGKTSYLNGIFVNSKPTFVSAASGNRAARLAANLGLPLIPAPKDFDTVDDEDSFTQPAEPDYSVVQNAAPAAQPSAQPTQQAPVYTQPYPQPNYGQPQPNYGGYVQQPNYPVGPEPTPGITPGGNDDYPDLYPQN